MLDRDVSLHPSFSAPVNITTGVCMDDFSSEVLDEELHTEIKKGRKCYWW